MMKTRALCLGFVLAAGAVPAMADNALHCPATFEGKSFMQVDVYDGPKSDNVIMKPLQDDAAESSAKPVAGWDRWDLTPRKDNQHYTLVCHYNNIPHERWGNQKIMTDVSTTIELPSTVRQCFQKRRADTTSLGITCK